MLEVQVIVMATRKTCHLQEMDKNPRVFLQHEMPSD